MVSCARVATTGRPLPYVTLHRHDTGVRQGRGIAGAGIHLMYLSNAGRYFVVSWVAPTTVM